MCHNLTEIVLQNHSVPLTREANTCKIGVVTLPTRESQHLVKSGLQTPPIRENPFHMEKGWNFAFFFVCDFFLTNICIMSYNT